MVAYDEFVQVEDGTHVFTVYTDIDKLEKHLKALSPADANVIKELTNAARRFTSLELSALPVTGTRGLIRMLRVAPALLKWVRISLQQYATRFTDPFLRKAFPTVLYDWQNVPMDNVVELSRIDAQARPRLVCRRLTGILKSDRSTGTRSLAERFTISPASPRFSWRAIRL